MRAAIVGPSVSVLLSFFVGAACKHATLETGASQEAPRFQAAINPVRTESDISVECVPGRAFAFPGDHILMRATIRGMEGGQIDWSSDAGELDTETLVFHAPLTNGRVSVTAKLRSEPDKTSTCSIDVVERPNVPSTGPGSALSVNTALGLPGPADDDPSHVLLVKDEYVMSYNSARKGPNWVAWQLDSTYSGGATRSRTWKIDSALPREQQAADSDYTSSGYDRGHMCPSADRTRLPEPNAATFTLTNALPQAHNLNGGPWQKLERYLQDLAAAGAELFIVAGGVFDEHGQTIGNGVAVPSATWKVAVVLGRLSDRAGEVTPATRVIAVVIPNDDSAVTLRDDWRPHRVRVDDIEALTGLDFLSEVDPSVQDAVEAEVDAAAD